jgi:hypothetical protein
VVRGVSQLSVSLVCETLIPPPNVNHGTALNALASR